MVGSVSKLLAAAALAAGGAGALHGQESVTWVSLGGDREGEMFYDPASVRRSGDGVRVRTRMTLVDHPNGWGAFVTDQQLDCARQTTTMVAAQGFTQSGELYRSVDVPEGSRKAEPMFAGQGYEPLYRTLCPAAAPLPHRPPPGPPPIATPPGSRDCDCD